LIGFRIAVVSWWCHQVVEVKNDLGLDTSDVDAIIAKLESQGVTDIKAVDTEGGC
jgi:hypothetical protein